jgi:hypothetical protein
LEIGGSGGSPQPTFWLSPGEYIEGVCGSTGDALDQVQFKTNTGRRSPLYGGNGGPVVPGVGYIVPTGPSTSLAFDFSSGNSARFST